jgi:hypothetical protein
MWRKNDASKDELDGVAQRLRDERPTASPLELDQIKRTAMSRAKVKSGGRTFGARRLAVAGLTVGLMAAGTGGVIAAGGGKGVHANAASVQYSSNECDNGNIVGGENSGNNNNFNCNSGTISINETNNNTINETNDSTTNNSTTNNSTNTSNDSSTNTTTNNYYSSTVTLSAAGTTASSGVLASKQTKASASKRSFSIHFFAAKGRKLKKLTVTLNGKVIKVLNGNQTKATLDFVGVACSNVRQNLKITGTLADGKKISETRHYNLCQ